MLTTDDSVSAAEVAYIVGITDKDINRLVDDHVSPHVLWWRDRGRCFAPLTAPFATFYFDASGDLTRAGRIRFIARSSRVGCGSGRTSTSFCRSASDSRTSTSTVP